MSNIIDKIQLSGVTYDIGGQGGSGVSVVEVTQAEYDALPSSAKTDASKMYIITDAQAGDLTNYYTKTETNTLLGGKADTATTYTKTEVDNAITAATSTKQDTLVSGTNIKTINNTSILGSGNIDIQGGGGKAIKAGRGISVTTGETADTVSFNLPISATTNDNLIIGDKSNQVNDLYNSGDSIVFGRYSKVKAYDSLVGGYYCSNEKGQSQVFGNNTKTKNITEFGCGKYNNSVSGSSTFGDSGNTLFSVGNGTADNARHNAFEIRQNGDIYLSSGGTDIKLQDHLGGGGGGGTVESAITSGSTNAVESKAIWSAVTYEVSINETLEFDNTYAATNYPSGCNSVTFENNTGGTLPTGDYIFTSGGSEIAKLTCSVISWWPYEVGWTSSDPKLTYVVAEGNSAVTASYSELASDIDGVTVPSAFTSAFTATASGENHLWINENTYRKDEVYNKSEINVLSGVVDTKLNTISGAVDTKLDATAYTPTIIDSTLNDNSNNPVANSALYDELRISNTTGAAETVITFDSDKFSENYPVECRKIKVELSSTTWWSAIRLLSDKSESGSTDNQIAWYKYNSQDPVTVELSSGLTEAGATYTISGNTFEVSYPSINNIQYIYASNFSNTTLKSIAPDTPLKDQVVANTTALGGLKFVKLTQTEYDNLQTKDNNTLYVIVN